MTSGDVFGFQTKKDKRADLPMGQPANFSGTGATRIAVALQFKGMYGVDAIIDNTDPVLPLTYRINSDAAAVKTVPVGGTVSINDNIINFIQIVSGGAWEIAVNLSRRL